MSKVKKELNLETSSVPLLFLERLTRIWGNSGASEFLEYGKLSTVRVNTIKTNTKDIKEILENKGIYFRIVPWNPQALIVEPGTVPSDLFQDGLLYSQGLSSMLPVLVLDPKPGDRVLDMCAAPGSKTTQMAAFMNNEGLITAIEAIRGRFYKLKSVITLLGAGNVEVKMLDARRYRNPGGFDKILVDAPCSSEGRFRTSDPESYAYWSPRKIKEMVRKQRGLLLSASRLLKPGGVMVYSTCTFAPEENEGVVDWLLRKTAGSLTVDPVVFDSVAAYPAIEEWEGRTYRKDVRNCMRVLPTKEMEGFFIAKFKKGTAPFKIGTILVCPQNTYGSSR